ncbi:MAG: hypothetical protein KAG87_06080 [Marinobacter adhaerens]|nr:hypothetical protein [Marinobacter adhaerens]
MTKFNTGNPVGSADPRDLSDNAKNFDEAVNNPSSATWTDRLGKRRVTLAAQLGYTIKGDYAPGVELTKYNDVIRYDGEFYGPAASTTLPYITTATLPDADSNLVGRGDLVLRQDLASDPSDGNAGSLLVNGVVHSVTSRTAMKAYDVPPGTQVSLKEGGRSGVGVIKSGTPPSDPQEGIFVVLNNGNYWERIIENDRLLLTWFGASGEDDGTVDNAAISACRAMAQAMKLPIIVNGLFELDETESWSGQPVAWIGERGALWRTGSDLTGNAALIWSGGASPMFSSASTGDYFEGIQTVNRGSATDFLEKTAGQRVYMRRMSFITGVGESAFSRSVIRSSGNFLGYSHFSAISCKGASPKFIDIDGLGTSNGITPFTIDGRSIFETGGSPLTVVSVTDEKIEHLKITDCTFNEKAGDELTVVDTTTSPLDPAINVFTFTDNEIDYGSGSPTTNRFARLENVGSIIWDGNTAALGGQIAYAVELINSTVVSFNGNYYRAAGGPYFNADANSKVVVGSNSFDSSNTFGASNNLASVGVFEVSYTSIMVLNPQLTDQRSNPFFRIDVTDNAGWQVRMSTTKPYWVAPGTRFSVQVRNVSGGAISGGAFTNGFVSGVLTTAPADGNHVIYEFLWDGTVAQPVSGVAPTEVSNS